MRRIKSRYTPEHSSRVNVAESELSAMILQCLSGRCMGDRSEPRTRTAAWSVEANARRCGVEWRMKIDDACCKPKSVYAIAIL